MKIQFNPFMPNTGVSKKAGLIIPNATSTAVTIERKMSTPQIFWILDLKVRSPRKIESLCAMLNEIKEGEHKYPYEVYKVPIESYFFNHFVVSSTFIGAQQYVEKYNAVKYNTW